MHCPFHIKARCGRAFCNHEYNKSKTKMCNKWSCVFYPESELLMGKKSKIKSEYPINKRYRNVMK